MTPYTLPDLLDNSDDLHRLSEALKYLLADGAKAHIATGYFNLAGFNLVRDALNRTDSVQLLLGKEPLISQTGGVPALELITEHLETDLEGENSTGTRESHARVRAFLEFLRQEKVEVALYTPHFLHAKAYIIENVPHFGKIAIVGSSNFTLAGLTQNTELNMVQKQSGAVGEFLVWFEKNWRAGTDYKDQIIKLYENAANLQSPFLIYLKSLYETLKDQFGLDISPSEGRPSPIALTEFQRDGYFNAKQTLETYQGVLIADSVGFGKTYLALRLLDDYAYQMRQKALVVCPAQLRDLVWEPKLSDYSIKADVISQEKISQDDFLPGLERDGKDYDFVVIDESHNFRNPKAQRSENLLTMLTRGKPKKVVLLTATPINTSVFDLYHQLRYITRDQDDYFAGVGVENLKSHFIQAEADPDLMVDVLQHISVRRSREFVRQNYREAEIDGRVMRFPNRALHKIDYNLQHAYEGLYDQAADTIENLTLAPYMVQFYRNDVPSLYRTLAGENVNFKNIPPELAWQLGRQLSIASLLRLLYLKRLESSVSALRISFNRQARFQKQFLAQLTKGRLLSSKNFQKLESILRKLGEDEDSEDQTEMDENNDRIAEILSQLEPVNAAEYDLDAIRRAVEHDIDLLSQMSARLEPLTAADDDKLAVLKKRLTTDLRGKKVIVFSYFKDTARYIFNTLKNDAQFLAELGHVRVAICDSGADKDERKDRVIRFSPTTYGRPEIKGTDKEIDLLISTDVLSEGQNLQDADTLINYDLHWNPVRMVQRAGRIDRLGSQFETAHIHNFNPEDALESLLNLVRRLTDRLAAINRAGLLDATVMGEVPTPRDFGALRRIAENDASVINDLESISDLNVGEFLKQELLNFINRAGKDRLEKLLPGSGSAKKSPTGRRGLFVHLRGGAQHFMMFWDTNESKWIEHRLEIMRLVRSAENEPIAQTDLDIYPIIERARERIVSRMRRAKVKLPRLQNPQNHVITLLRTQHNQDAIRPLLEYYGQPLPDPLLKKLRKIWNQNKDNFNELLRELDDFARKNPVTRSERPEIQELSVDELKLICYMVLV
jgi:superfamily II DNA or RNA helicase